MILRSLQPRIARHVVGVPFIDFGSLILALYDVENGISRELWFDSSPIDAKEKKPAYLPSTLALSCYTAQGVERPLASYPILVQPCYAAQVVVRPPAS
ncbi:hypothetical protein AAG906_017291 [Vitis piasezkii]